MKFSENIKPISYLKAHAPEVIRNLSENGDAMVITLHGEARAVLQDVSSYEQTQETLALLKILAMTGKSTEGGDIRPMRESFDRVRARVKN